MRMVFLLVAFLFTNKTFAQKATAKIYASLEFVELDHGLARVIHGEEIALKSSPSGSRGWLNNFEIAEVTDSIRAVMKANFGVVYMLKAKDTVDVDVDIEWIYPQEVINENNQKFKSVRYTTQRPTNIPSASSYSLDAPYEIVKGNWTMNIYVKKKRLYSKTFFLY